MIEAAQAALKLATATVDLVRFVLPVLGLDRVLSPAPALRRHLYLRRGVTPTKAQPGRQRVTHVVATPVPAFIVVPRCLDAGVGVPLLDVLVSEGVTADVVLQGAVSGELHLLLVLLIAVQDHLVRDRKSTRLNSSHGYISYAVFCLKKK